jgi:dipeptidase E
MDDPSIVAEGYAREPIWEGLGLIDFSIVPHVQSVHPEAEAAARALAWLKKNNLPVRGLRDGEAIIR